MALETVDMYKNLGKAAIKAQTSNILALLPWRYKQVNYMWTDLFKWEEITVLKSLVFNELQSYACLTEVSPMVFNWIYSQKSVSIGIAALDH